MEEERARQEAAAKKAAEENTKQEKGAEQPSGSQDATMTERSGLATSDAENKAADLMVSIAENCIVLLHVFILLLLWSMIRCILGCIYLDAPHLFTTQKQD